MTLTEIRQQCIGLQLIQLYTTPMDEGEELIPGLGNFYNFDTIFELENGKLYRLGDDFVLPWLGNIPLTPVEASKNLHFNNLPYQGKILTAILKNENGDVSILLDDEINIQHKTELGSELIIKAQH